MQSGNGFSRPDSLKGLSPRTKVAIVLLLALFAYNVMGLLGTAVANDTSPEETDTAVEEVVPEGTPAVEETPAEDPAAAEETAPAEEVSEPSTTTRASSKVTASSPSRSKTWTKTRLVRPLKKAVTTTRLAHNGALKVLLPGTNSEPSNQPQQGVCTFDLFWQNYPTPGTYTYEFSEQGGTGTAVSSLNGTSPPMDPNGNARKTGITFNPTNLADLTPGPSGQGYHIKVESDGKSKVFKVHEGCGSTDGSIKIVKALSGSSDTPPSGDHTFDFDGNVDQNLVLLQSNAYGNQDTGALTRAANTTTGYTVTEVLTTAQINAGWSIDSVSCNDGPSTTPSTTTSDSATFKVDANENVTCTFTNTFTAPNTDGSIKVVKALSGSSDTPPSGNHTFDFDGNVDQNLVLLQSNAYGNQDTGALTRAANTTTGYTVTEVLTTAQINAGWSIDSVSCNDGPSTTPSTTTSDSATFKVDANENVTCTFTNRFTQPTGQIKIVKHLDPSSAPIPNGNYDFDFDGAVDTNLTLSSPTFADDDTGFIIVNANDGGTAYTVTEDQLNLPGSGWSLTDVDCDDSDSTDLGSTASIFVSDGEDVTCTFTNKYDPATPTGQIKIVKHLDPNSDPIPNGNYDFDFDGAVDTNLTLSSPTFADDDTGFITANANDGGTAYTVTEDQLNLPGSGWSLTDVDCDDSDSTDLGSTASIFVSDGEDVTCTFTNKYDQPTSTLTVAKNVTTSGSLGGYVPTDQLFPFTGAAGTHSLKHGQTSSPAATITVPDNNVTFSEDLSNVPSGWTLTGVSCVDTADNNSVVPVQVTGTTASLNLTNGGMAVACTFTNHFQGGSGTPPPPPPPPPPGKGVIVVDKVTDPTADPTSFGFTLTGGSVNTNFNLTDAATPFDSGELDPGVYDVSETLPAGWNLTSATCDDGSLPGAVALAADETVTCTFVNTKRASIDAVLELIPSSGGTTTRIITRTLSPRALADFIFTGDLAATLQTNGANIGPNEVLPGTYSATETVAAGWTLTKIECTDPTGDSTGNVATGTATFRAAPGENVVCVFTNVQDDVKGGVITDPADPDADDETDDPEVLGRPPTALPLTGSDPVGLVAIAGLLMLSGATAILYVKRRIES